MRRATSCRCRNRKGNMVETISYLYLVAIGVMALCSVVKMARRHQ